MKNKKRSSSAQALPFLDVCKDNIGHEVSYIKIVGRCQTGKLRMLLVVCSIRLIRIDVSVEWPNKGS